MHKYEITPILTQILRKISKKDKATFEAIIKKIEEIANSYSIEHYKNLRHNMKDSQRVHVGPFVLVFSYDESKNLITFETFKHHDEIYR